MKSLTDSQKTFVDSPGSNYVRACPGSGKTRAIVARYLRRAAEEKRKGVALLSFTNVAVDEVGRRCGQNPELLRHPHFIGTFDGFIQRLIIGPRFASRNLLQPRFIESWDVQDVTKITPDPKRPYEFLSLEWFDFGEDNEPTLMQDRISGPFRVSRLKLYEAHEATCKRLAKEKRIARLKKGYIACSEARRQLLFRLRDPGRRDSTVELLAARFAEVIVDEAQDCGIEELELLKALVEQRVHVCLVGDPDQAIFEFRNAVPEKVHEFGRALGAEHVFDENFRSSPAICATNSSFRCFEGSDEAAGPNSDCDWPVYLLPFDALPKVGSGFSALVNKHGVDRRGAIVVSHATKHAAEAVGAGAHSMSCDRFTFIAARTALSLSSNDSTPYARKRALERFEAKLIEVFDGPEGDPLQDALLQLGFTADQYRSVAVRIAMSVDPSSTDRSGYAAKLRTVLANTVWPSEVKLKNLSPIITACPEEDWAKLGVADAAGALSWGTIHSVKGAEYDAVCVVIPHVRGGAELSGLQCWLDGESSEARRVLYVGVSRAKRLLTLAVPVAVLDATKNRLEQDSVTVEVCEML